MAHSTRLPHNPYNRTTHPVTTHPTARTSSGMARSYRLWVPPESAGSPTAANLQGHTDSRTRPFTPSTSPPTDPEELPYAPREASTGPLRVHSRRGVARHWSPTPLVAIDPKLVSSPRSSSPDLHDTRSQPGSWHSDNYEQSHPEGTAHVDNQIIASFDIIQAEHVSACGTMALPDAASYTPPAPVAGSSSPPVDPKFVVQLARDFELERRQLQQLLMLRQVSIYSHDF